MPRPKPKKNDTRASYCSAFGGHEDDRRTTFTTLGKKESAAEIYKKLRLWSRHWYVGTVLQLRHLFYDFGFQLKGATKADQKRVDDWMGELRNVKRLEGFRASLWRQVLLNQAAVSFWIGDQGVPTLLNLEEVDYKDKFGQERLIIRHGLSGAEIDKMDIPEEARERLKAKSSLEITPDDEVFHFEVLKHEDVGRGLGTPLLYGQFLTLDASDSLESHDATLANQMRRVFEQHKIGHEIKSGNLAGSPKHFWKKSAADAIKREIKGKVGGMMVVTNFDHAIEWPGVDSDRFAASRYEGIEKRLSYWAMPIHQLLFTQSQQPQLMRIFGVMAAAERRGVALHLQMVGAAFGWNFQVEPHWSDECFSDERLFSELLKHGLNGGPVSQETFLRQLRLDPALERQRKAAEAKLPKEQTTPIYDAAHGPGEPAAANGRPPGSGDRYARNSEQAPS